MIGYKALAPHAFELIMVLAVIDICITWTLYSGELRMSEIISRVMKISFFMFFILNFDKINQAILLSFQYAGLTAAGQPVDGALLKPSGIIDKGFEACGSTLTYMMNHKLSLLGPGLVMYTTYVFVTLAAFFFMAFQILITKIEFNVFATLAVILIPFGVLKQTQFLFQRTLSAVIAYGVKLMVMTFILGLFIALFDKSGGIPGWTPESEPNFGEMLQYALSYAAMAFLMWQLPNLAAGFMNGQPSLEGQQAISGAKQIATTAAALVAMPFTGGASAAAAGKGAMAAKAGSAMSTRTAAREAGKSVARKSFSNSNVGKNLIKGAAVGGSGGRNSGNGNSSRGSGGNSGGGNSGNSSGSHP
nr:type IV secretion system protein [uncultured Selenomonas sp.]